LIDGFAKNLFRKKNIGKTNTGIFMFVCTTVLYEYMESLGNDVCTLFVYYYPSVGSEYIFVTRT
jgi:hypothetical protein